jgi:hypothetical protein
MSAAAIERARALGFIFTTTSPGTKARVTRFSSSACTSAGEISTICGGAGGAGVGAGAGAAAAADAGGCGAGVGASGLGWQPENSADAAAATAVNEESLAIIATSTIREKR